MGGCEEAGAGSNRERVGPTAARRTRRGLRRTARGRWARENIEKLLAQPADERHLFLFARSHAEGNYLYRLSDTYDDATSEYVDDLVLPNGISDVWFRGRARRDPQERQGSTAVWLARFQAGVGWHRYVVNIEERHLPSPNRGIADDSVPEGWRQPKDRAVTGESD